MRSLTSTCLLVSVLVTNQGCSGSSSGNSPAPRNISVSATRTFGVAPLGVFFDTEGTTWPTTSRPIHELDYSWDFGAGTESDVSSGGRYFHGFNAAHVFETAGTYNVTLTVTDTLGDTAEKVVTIEVSSEPSGGWDTYCFSNDADFSGCPAEATQVQTSYWSGEAGEDVLDYVGQNRRLVLARGDVFSYTATSPVGEGLMLISAFGIGANPVIQFTGNRPNSWELGAMESVGREVRFTDIDFRLHSAQGTFGTIGGEGILLLRISNENGICFLNTDEFVVDSHFSNIDGGPSYGSGERIAVIGTEFGPSHSHSVYGECQPKAIFTGNYFHDASDGTGIRLAPNTCSSHNILVSNNRFTNFPLQPVEIKVTTTNDERFQVSDVVIEKNVFSQSGGMHMSRDHGCSRISIRNNVFDLGNGDVAIDLSATVSYHPNWAKGVDGLWVYNNLFRDYSSTYPTWGHLVVLAQEDARDVVFVNNIFTADGIGEVNGWIHALRASPALLPQLVFGNNLYYFPDMTTGKVFNIGDVEVGDLARWQSYGGYGLDEGSIVGAPLFVDPDNGNFRLQGGSPGINDGREIRFIFDDLDGASRSENAPWDIGPYEHGG